MKHIFIISSLFILALSSHSYSQQVLNSTLLKADKLFINRDYANAVNVYLLYLEKFPRDYYAERQAAICYNHLNIPDLAIDHWPIVVESSEATEYDFLEYGRSLLMNDRAPHAKKIFAVLSRSTDPALMSWAKQYANPSEFFKDTNSVKVVETIGINTERHESSPITLKGKLFYIQNDYADPHEYQALSKYQTEHVAAAVKKDSVHIFPANLIEKLHAMSVSGPVSFSSDGKILYFTKAVSNKELKVKSRTSFYRYQIYALTMSTINNYMPDIKKFKHNQNEFDFMHPSISNDGKRLYFASNMRGSIGGMDIFMCEIENGDWGKPVNVGATINTSGNEVYPNAASDSTLFFASDRRPGLGGLDIFYTKRSMAHAQEFNEALNAGAPINSRFDDFGVCELRAGKTGYFSSKRKLNHDDDIYYFYGWDK